MFFRALAGLIFAAGLFVRLSYLTQPPLDFHPTRQLHSALIARGMYYENLPGISAIKREMALRQWRAEGVIEPQVFERLVAFSYGLAGGVSDWIPRVYSSVFWVAGGVLLFRVMQAMAGDGGALVGAAFYLLWPFGVSASRSFQPDPLMVALVIAAVWAIRRWEGAPSWHWAVASGLLAGFAIYIKTVAVFFVGPAFLAVILAGPGVRRAIKGAQVWAIAVLAIWPYALYLLDGVVIHGFLLEQFGGRFFPEMWSDPAFYLRWVGELSQAVPFALCLAALVGSLLPARAADRALLMALWGGYALYSFTLPHHISTHDYYSLALIPLTALGLACIAGAVLNRQQSPPWVNRAVFSAALAAGVILAGYQNLTSMKRSDAWQQAEVWQSAGSALHPGASVVILSPDYGMGIEYWGWVVPTVWPTVADQQFEVVSRGQATPFSERFFQLVSGRDYFLVSPASELDEQPELKETLRFCCRLLRREPGYLLYDLNPLQP